MGGDDPTPKRSRGRPGGRPPRGRGRRRARLNRVPNNRKTPARAGTTLWMISHSVREREDPRAGGDDVDDLVARERVRGRPPRGRGRLQLDLERDQDLGKTPARAGTTAVGRLRRGPAGRPPRGRGRRGRLRVGQRDRRKTPARAGTTSGHVYLRVGWEEDPRAGGDDGSEQRHAPSAGGRPPRGRGRRMQGPHDPRVHGRPPRGRGRLNEHGRLTPSREDPRAGGDDGGLDDREVRYLGRPPRAGGDDWPAGGRGVPVDRKTPARAGTTCSRG